MATKNPREPKAVKALIAKHTTIKNLTVQKTQRAETPHVVEGGRVIPTASLWSRIRRRRNG